MGHLQSNVHSACIRCNLARGDMPYAAWLLLVPAMKQAKELGLFKEWDEKRKKTEMLRIEKIRTTKRQSRNKVKK